MSDREWMKYAILQAKAALSENEVPVGAVIVKDGSIISFDHNRCVSHNDPSLHAEILVLKDAYRKLGSLSGCTMYVTLEPCVMCAGTMIEMRLPRLVYGAFDSDFGCCGSRLDLTDHWFDHTVETIGGLCEEECAELLNHFFKELRNK